MNEKGMDLVLWLAYCALLFWLSEQSGIAAPKFLAFQDKIIHTVLYGVLGFLTWKFFRHFIDRPIVLLLACVSFTSLYGLSDEFHQSFVPGRTSDSIDWLMDTLGAGSVIVLLILRSVNKKKSPDRL